MIRRVTLTASLLLLATFLLFAATGTVVPSGDVATGSWGTTPLWSKINEDIDNPNGTVIVSGNNPGSGNAVTFNVSCPGDIGTITEANLRIRAREQGNGASRTIDLAVSWSATATTNFSTGALTATLDNYASGNKTGLSISQSGCSDSTITATPTTTGTGPAENGEIDSFNVDVTYDVAAGGQRRAVLMTWIRQ